MQQENGEYGNENEAVSPVAAGEANEAGGHGSSGHHCQRWNPTPLIWVSRNIAPSAIIAIPANLLLCITSHLHKLETRAPVATAPYARRRDVLSARARLDRYLV